MLCDIYVIDILGSNREEPKKIILTELSDHLNEEMIRMFYENKLGCEGKVVDVTVNTEGHYAIVEFTKSAGLVYHAI